MPHEVVLQTNLPLPLFGRGKVRDTYDLGDRLLMVATDRVSVFDVILGDEIPDKGRVLTALSTFWFERTRDIIPNHLIGIESADLPESLTNTPDTVRMLADRFMLVRKAKRLDFECVVRGYLAGSGWADYQRTGAVCGVKLPAGLRQADQLPEPIFTPATKAETGHDINISLEEMKNSVGEDIGQAIADVSIAIYRAAATYALDRGIIIADTKMEFGLLDEQLILIDEVLTPDSSRFWAVGEYAPGASPPSFDKQYVRDWLTSPASGWDRSGPLPPPPLPPEVVERTQQTYVEAYSRLTGLTWA